RRRRQACRSLLISPRARPGGSKRDVCPARGQILAAERDGLVKNKRNTSSALAASARGWRQHPGFKHQNEARGESAMQYVGTITSSTTIAARPRRPLIVKACKSPVDSHGKRAGVPGWKLAAATERLTVLWNQVLGGGF